MSMVALAASRDSKSRRQHLAPVETGDGSRGAGESLADRLSHAQAAVAAPRRRVSELEAALAAAIERADYAAAAEFQEQLPAAREALALAEVDVRVITEAQAALAAAADAERREIAEAQRRDDARRVIENSVAAEAQAAEARDTALAAMRSYLGSAKAAYQQALAVEGAIGAVRHQAVQAQHVLGEFPPGDPGPRVVGSNVARSLADSDPLVAALAGWRG
jgi:hypothetical protein